MKQMALETLGRRRGVRGSWQAMSGTDQIEEIGAELCDVGWREQIGRGHVGSERAATSVHEAWVFLQV